MTNHDGDVGEKRTTGSHRLQSEDGIVSKPSAGSDKVMSENVAVDGERSVEDPFFTVASLQSYSV